MEWMSAINLTRESLRPNYVGQLAQRHCLHKTVDSLAGGTYRCTPSTGTNIYHEPNIKHQHVAS